MNKKIVFLDMDGVLADFDAAVTERDEDGDPIKMKQQHFFRYLRVKDCAKDAVRILLRQPHLDVYIGSKPTTKYKDKGIDNSYYCATEKYQWIATHFPELIKKINLVCDKGLLLGDYLIDDDAERWEDKFTGTFIHFNKDAPLSSWMMAFAKMRVVLDEVDFGKGNEPE